MHEIGLMQQRLVALSDRTSDGALARLRVAVRGAVQGVGFRPCVYRLASSMGLNGWVSNTAQGVIIEVEGRQPQINTFLLRLEAEGPAAQSEAVLLTEIFVDDMDGTLRQIGIGDYVVSKHVGRMMGALGGRLGAFRAADEGGTGYAEAVRRNIFHEAPPSEAAVAAVSARLERFAAALGETGKDDLRAGRLPAP